MVDQAGRDVHHVTAAIPGQHRSHRGARHLEETAKVHSGDSVIVRVGVVGETLGMKIPALLTTVSTRPNRSMAASMMRWPTPYSGAGVSKLSPSLLPAISDGKTPRAMASTTCPLNGHDRSSFALCRDRKRCPMGNQLTASDECVGYSPKRSERSKMSMDAVWQSARLPVCPVSSTVN